MAKKTAPKEVTQKEVTLNLKQRLYVIPAGGGYSCYGFDVLFDKLTKLNAWLNVRHYGKAAPTEDERGTLALYDNWLVSCSQASSYCTENNTRCDIELTPQLLGIEGRVVKVIDKWGEVNAFKVGKSTGWMPCHLMLESPNAHGGGAVFGAPFQSVTVLA